MPALEEVREDVWALAQPMPGGHLAYSFSYLLRRDDGGVHVIDPGWDSAANWERLLSALTTLTPGRAGADAVTGIIGTHLHPDHVGLAAHLRAASGAPLALHGVERRVLERHSTRLLDLDEALARLEAWGVPEGRRRELVGFVDRSPEHLALSVDQDLVDGELLDLPGFRVEVMATPGHTAGHICLRDDERGLLYTGDHVLPTVFAGLGLGGPTASNPLADYIVSVARLEPYGSYEALPGHEHRFRGLAERARTCLDHHLVRTREVAAILEGTTPGSGGPSIWEIASRLTWTARWNGLAGLHLLSALRQTEMHVDFVTAGLPLDGTLPTA
ncbi:MBL fold metallo-hydrolase [Arthrobacter echini]|uniref:MBL fold metallo-hydrolase n=1 Tax=Arthrobacter echini TaxID=1529066 RepID=A0A4S5EAR6_9MICC|nr:MBL fold metallo-hydrolase [Arthrobacter echini]